MSPFPIITPGRRQSKTPILSRNIDLKSLETEFSIAIWRQMAIENTVSIVFLSAIVDSVFDCRLPGVIITGFIFLAMLHTHKIRMSDSCRMIFHINFIFLE